MSTMSAEKRSEVSRRIREYVDAKLKEHGFFGPHDLGYCLMDAIDPADTRFPEYTAWDIADSLTHFPIKDMEKTVTCYGFCNRDELSEVAKTMESMALDGGIDGDELVLSRGGCHVLAQRIRRAIGEEQ